MQPLSWERRPDGLRAPALVCAFKGWNDAGDAASAALTFIGASLGAARFAPIDPEEFFDFQATRPTSGSSTGAARDRVARGRDLRGAGAARAARPHPAQGPEPSMRWRTFCEQIVDLAEALGVQMVVTLGALLADVPHTRPVAITGLASDEALIERLGLQPSSYEGPTGIVGVLHAACAEAGIPSVWLWAAVPHYVAVAPNPKAALALVRKLEGLVGVTVDARSSRPRRRLRAPGHPRRGERPRRPGVRRAPRAGGRGGGGRRPRATCPPATCSPASSSASCASAARRRGRRAAAARQQLVP